LKDVALPVLKHFNHNDMRNRNLALILNCMHQEAPISRASISKRTGINKATVTGVVRELIQRGIIIEAEGLAANRKIGHPAIPLRINPDAGRVVGVQISRGSIQSVVADVVPCIQWRQVIDTHDLDQQAVLSATRDLIQAALLEARRCQFPVLGVGLSIPGVVDIRKNILLRSHELGWGQVDLSCLSPADPGIPFYAGNEGHMLALGDRYYGISSNSEMIVYVNLGIEISGGILVNSNVLPGDMGLAGELGHMSVDASGRLCACGARGCWNTYVSQEAFIQSLRLSLASGRTSTLVGSVESNKAQLSIGAILIAAASGDDLVLEELCELGKWLGRGIANLINLLNPEFAILGGPLSDLFDYFYPAMKAEIEIQALPWHRENVKIDRVKSHEDECVLGAIATVLWNLLNNIQQSELG
jgi:N-acetylglucosamine repressor